MQIRKCERVIVYNATEVANLNPEDFKTEGNRLSNNGMGMPKLTLIS